MNSSQVSVLISLRMRIIKLLAFWPRENAQTGLLEVWLQTHCLSHSMDVSRDSNVSPLLASKKQHEKEHTVGGNCSHRSGRSCHHAEGLKILSKDKPGKITEDFRKGQGETGAGYVTGRSPGRLTDGSS